MIVSVVVVAATVVVIVVVAAAIVSVVVVVATAAVAVVGIAPWVVQGICGCCWLGRWWLGRGGRLLIIISHFTI